MLMFPFLKLFTHSIAMIICPKSQSPSLCRSRRISLMAPHNRSWNPSSPTSHSILNSRFKMQPGYPPRHKPKVLHSGLMLTVPLQFATRTAPPRCQVSPLNRAPRCHPAAGQDLSIWKVPCWFPRPVLCSHRSLYAK